MEKLANFDQNNNWGGCNKQGGWQKISKVNIIHGELGINEEVGKFWPK